MNEVKTLLQTVHAGALELQLAAIAFGGGGATGLGTVLTDQRKIAMRR